MDYSKVKHGLVAACVLNAFCAVAQTETGTATATSVSFWSGVVRLAGEVWKPDGVSAESKTPAILLCHGWGGEKSHLNAMYAPVLSRAGFIVMTFDYAGWGESRGQKTSDNADSRSESDADPGSDGEIREVVDPLAQLEDIRSALAFLSSEPGVDPDNLGIWGTSLGGGLVLQTAAQFPQIKAMVTQVGAVNSLANFGGPTFADYGWQLLLSNVRAETPVFADPAPGLRGRPNFVSFSRYDPFKHVDQLKAAVLIIDAEDEELFRTEVNGKALYEAIKDRLPAKYVETPGGHYNVYNPRDPAYQTAVRETVDWFATHLQASAE